MRFKYEKHDIDLTISGDSALKFRCDCNGFRFRKKCRHVSELAESASNLSASIDDILLDEAKGSIEDGDAILEIAAMLEKK
jgi:hypothetical protein